MSCVRHQHISILFVAYILMLPLVLSGSGAAQGENNDPVIEGIEAYDVKTDGIEVPVAEKMPMYYSFKHGRIYRMDVTDLVTDLDEGIEAGTGTENINNLTFDWTSNIQGVLGNEPSVLVSIGKKSSQADVKLKAGKEHNITIRVTDPDGGSDSYTFTVKAQAEPQACCPEEPFCFFTIGNVGMVLMVLSVPGVQMVNRRARR